MIQSPATTDHNRQELVIFIILGIYAGIFHVLKDASAEQENLLDKHTIYKNYIESIILHCRIL